MPPAIIGGALAAAGGIASAAIGSSAAGKAASASQSAADAAAAEQRAAREQAYSTLNPYIQAGLPATQNINALLGLAQPTQDWNGYLAANPDVAAGWSAMSAADKQQFPTAQDYAQWHYQHYGQNEGRAAPAMVDGAAQANQAFDTFRNSTGYDWRLKQGMNALNSGYAGAGTIKSGAAIKGAIDYGQGMASQEFGNYLNALGNQQGIGLQAGSSAAGVSQNVANSLGNIYQQNGANQANASLARASALGNGISGIANIAGSILAPSYGGVNAAGLNSLTASNTAGLASQYGSGFYPNYLKMQ